MEKTLLLVEDEEFTRVFLARFIERKGVTVIVTGTGKTAIEEYKRNSPQGVLLDISLPDIQGVDVCKKIKEFDPNAKIYFISGLGDVYLKQKTQELGAAGFIQKPITLEEISTLIDKL